MATRTRKFNPMLLLISVVLLLKVCPYVGAWTSTGATVTWQGHSYPVFDAGIDAGCTSTIYNNNANSNSKVTCNEGPWYNPGSVSVTLTYAGTGPDFYCDNSSCATQSSLPQDWKYVDAYKITGTSGGFSPASWSSSDNTSELYFIFKYNPGTLGIGAGGLSARFYTTTIPQGPASTSTSLVASNSTYYPQYNNYYANYGTPITITATVSPAPSNGDTVTFYDSWNYGTASVLGTATIQNGVAKFTTRALLGEWHGITANFSGDSSYKTSTSPALGITMYKVNSTTSLSSSSNPSTYTSSITFTATVTPTPPNGETVTFYDSGTQIGTGTTSGGVVTFTTTTLTPGTHSITARYPDDYYSLYTSTSPALSQTVNKEPTAISLTSNSNPSTYGTSVIFTATVSPSVPNGETVTFYNGGTQIGIGTTSGSTATFTATTLAAGTYSITATYSGDSNYIGSTSSAVSQVVSKVSTTTSLSSSPNPAIQGTSVTFTATVSPSVPNGETVTFYSINNGTQIGTGTTSGSIATFTTNTLTAGTRSFTATYSGNSNYASSTSSAVSQAVNKVSTTTSLSSSFNPSIHGASVTFTATVSPSVPNGETVTFYDNSVQIGTGTTTSSSVATFTTNALTAGTHSITATYYGDAHFLGSSSTLSQTINAGTPTATSLTSSINPSTHGTSVTFTATVSPSVPNGETVTFYNGGTQIGTGTTSGSVVTFTTAVLAVGTDPITATYSGDVNFFGSTSSAVSQTVNKQPTIISLNSNATQSLYGSAATFTARISTPIIPNGETVTFYDGTNQIGTSFTSNSTAILTTDGLAAGTHSITATYSGDSNFTSSTSSAVSQVVTKLSASTYTPSTWVLQSNTLSVGEQGQSCVKANSYIYCMGGLNYPTTVQSAQILSNGGTSAWASSSNTLSYSSAFHSCVSANGYVYCMGGEYSPAGVEYAKILGNGQLGQWHAQNASAQLSAGVQGLSCVTVNSYIYCMGGYNASTSTYLGNIQYAQISSGGGATGPWHLQSANTLVAGLAYGSCVTANNYIYCMGGVGYPTTIEYAPIVANGVVGSWQTMNPSNIYLPVSLYMGSCAAAAGSIYCMGGQNANAVQYARILNGSGTSAWTLQNASMQLAVGAMYHSCIAANNYLYCMGDNNNRNSIQYTPLVTPTTTSVNSNNNPSTYGASVALTAAVFPAVPNGQTVTFYDNSIQIGTATTSNSNATIASSTLAIGTHSITARYSGYTNAKGSISAVLSQIVKTPTTTSLTSSANPSAYGNSITFTATVSPSIPNGETVTFYDSANQIGTGTTAGSVATFSTNALATGTHQITATYSGDSNFVTSTSSAVSQVVNTKATTTSLASSANPSTYGNSVTFTATISPSVPNGETVTFYDNGATIGTSTTFASVATFATNAFTAGTHPITATYAGDSNFVTSTSSAVSQVVNKKPTATSLASSANPTTYGNSITFTATVSPSVPNGETVTFYDSSNQIGTGTTSANVATFTTNAFAAGTHPITATYSGDSNFVGSTSSAVSQIVNKKSTTSTLISGANPSTYGNSITFTATVSPSIPNGETVTFYDSANQIGTGTTAGSVATFSTNTLVTGTHPVTATYSGDSNFVTSTSSAVSQVVNTRSTSTALTSNSNPSTYTASITFTATVSPSVPNGETVTFYDSANQIGTGTTSGSVATFSTNALTAGTHPITATYSGDSNFVTSTSSAVSQVVNTKSTATALTSNSNPSTYTASITFTATVSPSVPNGETVTFYDSANQIGTGTTSGSVATLSTNALTAGTHPITATYSGDSNFITSTSSAVSQVVNTKSTATALTSNSNPSTYTSSIMFTATVSPSVPNGETVTFYDNSIQVGIGTTSSSVATFTTNAFTAGTYQITATYSGDSNFVTSTSSAVSQVVNTKSTATALTSNANPSTYTASITFTATVSPSVPNGETVTFYDSANQIGTGTTSGSVATLSTNALTAGTHPITATYSGDSNFITSTSSAVSQVVNTRSTATALTSNSNPSTYTSSIMFTATVSPSVPNGETVTFYDNSIQIGTGITSSSTATFSTNSLIAGTHPITATYSGDSNFITSTSSAVSQVVNTRSTATALTSNSNPSTYTSSIMFTATVSPSVPNGETVTFYDNSIQIGTGITSSSTATFSTNSLIAGTQSITATYSGDSNFIGSTSTPISQVVNDKSTTTSLVSNANPSTYSNTITFTATVSPSVPNDETVTFYNSGTQIGTGTTSSSTAMFTTNALVAGTQYITATYSGDSNFTGSTSSAFSQTVDKESTMTSLISSANPSLYGSNVMFTATVSPSVPNGESIVFYAGTVTPANLIGSSTTSSSAATLTTAFFKTGTAQITAAYEGDANFVTSNSIPLSQTLNPVTGQSVLVSTTLNSIDVGSAATVSASLSGLLFNTSAATYSWSTTGSCPDYVNPGNVQSFVYYSTALGTTANCRFSVSVHDAYGNSGSGISNTFTVDAIPTVSVSGTAIADDSQTITLTATATGTGLTYQWYNDTTNTPAQIGGATSNVFTETANVVGTFYYYVVVTDQNNAQVRSGDSEVVVYALPTVSVSGTSAADTGQTITLTAAATGTGLTYQWYNDSTGTPSQIHGAVSSTLTKTAVSAGTLKYYVLVTDLNGKQAQSANSTVIVSAPPTVSTSGTTTADVGQTITLTATASGTGLTYQWYNDSTGTPVAITLGGTSNTFTETANVVGTFYYYVVATDQNNVQARSADSEVMVSALPTVSISGTSAADTGQTITLTAAATGTGLTYQWYNDTSTPIQIHGAVSNTLTKTAGATGTFKYYVIVTDSNNEQAQSADSQVVVSTVPVNSGVEVSGTTTADVSQTITLTATATGTGLTYQWYNDTTNTPVQIAGATSNVFTETANAIGTFNYYVVVTDQNNVQARSADSEVMVSALPTVSVSGTSAADTGQTITLTAAATGTGLTYQWYNDTTGTPGQIHGAVSSTLTKTAGATGTFEYYVLVTDLNGKQAQSANSPVTVSALPTVSTSGTTSVDTGNIITFTATATGTGLTYQWYNDSGEAPAQIAGATSNTLTRTAGATGAFDYYAVVTDSNGEHAQSSDSEVLVSPAPTVSVSGTTAIDTGQTITLTATATGTGLTYQWYNDTTGTPIRVRGAISSTLTRRAGTIGTFKYYVMVTDLNNEQVQSANASVLVSVLPAVSASGTAAADAGQAITLTASTTGGTGPMSYQWYNDSGEAPAQIAGATSNTFAETANVVGTFYYYVVATDHYGNHAQSSPDLQVVVTPSPTVSVSGTSSADVGQSITLNSLRQGQTH